MTFPAWAAFGLLAAALSAGQMLLQERLRVAPLAVAFWCKAACALALLPFVIAHGVPRGAFYYALLAAQSLLWVVSDVVFYRGINEASAGVISRVLPIGTILSFFLWFAVDWKLARAYLAAPGKSAAIVGVLCLLVLCAWRLKKCAVTTAAVRRVWFVLFASVAGSVSTKYITQQADVAQGVYSYVFFEALIMMALWGVWYVAKRPLPAREMFGAPVAKKGLAVGFVAAGAVTATVYAVYNIDNPAYVGAVRYLDSVMILGANAVLGRPNRGNVWAGLGIVACAAALIVLKAR